MNKNMCCCPICKATLQLNADQTAIECAACLWFSEVCFSQVYSFKRHVIAAATIRRGCLREVA